MHGRLPGTIRYVVSALVLLTTPAVGLLRAADAATVTLEWDSNRESDLAGYLVIYGTASGQLTLTVDVGNHTSYQFTNLETGRTYFFAVRAYNTAGLRSAPSAEVSTTIGIAPLSLTNFMANLTPPRQVGTTVIFAAAASGGMPPYQYKWFVSDGSKSTMARDWSGDNTFTWHPSVANPNYAVKAWARGATNTGDAPENSSSERSLPFAITPVDPTGTVINLVADREAPQPNGTRIVFTATVKGGSATYEFQWSLFDGASWKVLQDFSTDAKLSWTPTVPNPKYQVMVRVRGGRNLAANAGIAMPFPVK
jgi:hypothetical protein